MVVTGLEVGGAEKVVIDLSDGFAKRGHIVNIVFLTGKQILFPNEDNIKIHSLKLSNFWGIPKAIFNLRKIIVTLKPDIIHAHMFHANILTRLTRLTVSVPKLICTAHSVNEGGNIRMLCYRLTNFLSNNFTHVSQEGVNAFECKNVISKGKMLAVPNGINLKEFAPNSSKREATRNSLDIKENEKMLLAIGRLEIRKDYPNLLYAFKIVNEKYKNTKLFITGEGSLQEQLFKLSSELELTESVFFLGTRHDIPDLLSAADIFTLSSVWEGFSLVTLEAMANGKLIVATDSGGPKEILQDLGFVIPPKDSNAMANAIIKALNLNDSDSNQIKLSVIKRAKDFSYEKILDRWIELYMNSN